MFKTLFPQSLPKLQFPTGEFRQSLRERGFKLQFWNFPHGGIILSEVCCAIATVLLTNFPAQAQIQGFNTPRFTTDNTGNIRIFGNALLTCDIAVANCAAAQTGGIFGNNEFNMVYVDIDGDTSTFNSSEANISLPAGSSVLWAGLYWGGDTSTGSLSNPPQLGAPNPAQRNQVRFQTPASGGYVDLTSADLFEFPASDSSPSSDGIRYQAFQDVTSLVQAGGEGNYRVANVQAGNGLTQGGLYGDWSLVVVFSNPAASLRNLTVFDGLTEVETGTTLSINVDGFITPTSGEFNARLGAVVYEGDRNITGDSLLLNGNAIPPSAARNPTGNFFNSSILGLGTDIRNPNFGNQLGFDIIQINLAQEADRILGNGRSQATATFTTEGDAFLPGVIAFAIDTFRPTVDASKEVSDLNGSTVQPGDVLEYEITVRVTGIDIARNLVLNDPVIPANTTYIPDSLVIIDGPGAGAQTDAAGDDLAEIDLDTGSVTFRLGNGATAQGGGTLAPPSPDGSTPGESTTVRFLVQVNDDTPPNTVISNQAVVTFQGGSTTTDFTETTDGDDPTPGDQPTSIVVGPNDTEGLSLFKRITGITRSNGEQLSFMQLTGNAPDPAILGAEQVEEDGFGSGDEVEYTIYYRVTGDLVFPGVQICDPLPEAVTYVPGSLQLQLPGGGAIRSLTDIADDDEANVISPLTPLTPPCPEVTNSSETVRAAVGDVSNVAGSNLGFLRFRVRLD